MNTKKVIAIGLLTSAVITLVAFGIKTKTFTKVTTPVANKQTIRVNAEESLTDLSNTKWYFNDTLTEYTPTGQKLAVINEIDEQYNINFYENGTIYKNRLGFHKSWGNPATINPKLQYSLQEAYNYTTETWTKSKYITISTGGADVQNTYLINWFKQNATQITITDLTNSSWKINESLPTITAGYLNASINFYNNGNEYSAFKLGYNYDGTQLANSISYGNYLYYNNSQWQWTQSDQTYTQSSKIIITDGTDTTNETLIIWLTLNAKQYEEITTTLNTKWTFIDNPRSNLWNYDFNINFTSNKKTCSELVAGRTTKNNIIYAYKTDATSPYTLNQIYDGTNWTNNKFKIIIISGGNDVTSLSLISFLTCNAEGTSYTPIPTNNADDYDIENGNFVSLQSLMIQILTMPFSFISQAFNITLWPNTAWEFNLSNFILALIAIATIMFIIKLFTSGFSVIGRYTQSRDNREFKRSQTKLNNAKTKQINENKPKVTHTYIHKDK